jgi:hypothetical protein
MNVPTQPTGHPLEELPRFLLPYFPQGQLDFHLRPIPISPLVRHSQHHQRHDHPRTPKPPVVAWISIQVQWSGMFFVTRQTL